VDDFQDGVAGGNMHDRRNLPWANAAHSIAKFRPQFRSIEQAEVAALIGGGIDGFLTSELREVVSLIQAHDHFLSFLGRAHNDDLEREFAGFGTF
jgi:hypothetical protein